LELIFLAIAIQIKETVTTKLAFLLVRLAAGLIAIEQLGFLAVTAPKDLGVTMRRLMPSSRAPNSVNSRAHLYANHRQRN